MKKQLNPKVFELAAQLLCTVYSDLYGEKFTIYGCCYAIIKAARDLSTESKLVEYQPYIDYIHDYFYPHDFSVYWWKMEEKTSRIIALTICAEILREENKTFYQAKS